MPQSYRDPLRPADAILWEHSERMLSTMRDDCAFIRAYDENSVVYMAGRKGP